MRNKFKFLLPVYNFFIFVIAIAVIVYLFPKEGAFPYEIRKGAPWQHENLIAPFNFAIYKTPDELRKEKKELLKNFKPYFKIDSQIVINQLTLFKFSFDTIWNKYLGKVEQNTRLKQEFLSFSIKQLNQIYAKGILEISDLFENKKTEDIQIVLVENNVAKELTFNEIYTRRSAYEYLVNVSEDFWDKRKTIRNEIREKLDAFFNDLKINDFIQPNLIYDETTSDKVEKSMTEKLSLTRGMIQKGENIINKGENINDEKFSVLMSLKNEYESAIIGEGNNKLIILGRAILVMVLMIVLWLFLYTFRRDILANNTKTTFIMVLQILMIYVASYVTKSHIVSINLIPFALVPVIIRTFYDTRLALFVHLIVIFITGFFAPNGFEFIFTQFIAGMVSILMLSRLYRRQQLFSTSIMVFISYSVVYFSFSIIQEGELNKIDFNNFGWFAANSALLLLSYPLIYIFEKSFGFISNVSLMELADTNHPLLRYLAEKAPGTFQHSIQVANLVEEAVFKIGGNPHLARTGALYHDVGKAETPQYFIENQFNGINPHDHLEFDKSAELIIHHINYGVHLARKYSIPSQVIDFIKTHHGTSKALFFYRSYLKKYPDKEIDNSKFTYPGPTPYSKETAVVMMADGVEAASRGLKEINEDTIRDLVETIIDSQIAQQQFYNSNITFKDITVIKEIFKRKLVNIYHARKIEYPKG